MNKIKIVNNDGTEVWIKKPKKDASALEKRTKGEKILYIIVAVILSIHVATLFVPWVWTFLSALKGKSEFVLASPLSLPKNWKFENFITVFSELVVDGVTFPGMIWNSVWYIVLNSSLDLFVPACTGYVMSKYRFRGRDFIYSVAIASMTIPIIGTMASDMKLLYAMGIYDTPLWVVWTSIGGFGGTFLIYYGYFKNIAWDYAEAAMMDGGGPYTIFFRIMLPQAMPLLTTYAITGAIASWGDYMSFVTYMPSWPNLATGLYTFQATQERISNYPIYYAGVIWFMVPSIIIFCTASGKIMTSLSIGGLKG